MQQSAFPLRGNGLRAGKGDLHTRLGADYSYHPICTGKQEILLED